MSECKRKATEYMEDVDMKEGGGCVESGLYGVDIGTNRPCEEWHEREELTPLGNRSMRSEDKEMKNRGDIWAWTRRRFEQVL